MIKCQWWCASKGSKEYCSESCKPKYTSTDKWILWQEDCGKMPNSGAYKDLEYQDPFDLSWKSNNYGTPFSAGLTYRYKEII